MKLLHMADLHIGKRVNEFSMLEDQRYILEQIVGIARQEEADAILIAGDVYDKAQPQAEAVALLDDFLTKLAGLSKPVFIISGNHDSPERLGFLSRVTNQSGLFIAGVFDGRPRKITLWDAHGPVHIHLLPFLKPATARPFLDEAPQDYDAAVRAVINAARPDTKERNVLVCHQFVTAGANQPERSDSEAVSAGGLDNVDVSAFEDFDYVALGHLHGPQRMGRDTVRYAGSPLKYSFSEARHQKSVTLIAFGPKGQVDIRLCPLDPLRDLRRIKGPLEALLCIGREEGDKALDYIHATLTDDGEIYDALGRVREVYPNLMALDFQSTQTDLAGEETLIPEETEKSPLALFGGFYLAQNGREMTPAQQKIMQAVFEDAGGEGA